MTDLGFPLQISDVTEERYGTCRICDRTVRWWNDELAARWVHVQPMAVTGPNAHRAEVAEEQRCQNCAPGYDCESGIYAPTNLAEAGPAAAPTLERDA